MAFGQILQKRTPTIFAGRLRHRINIVQVSKVQDSTGGLSLSVNTIYTGVWASIEALSGMDKFAAHEFISQVTHQITIRYVGAAPSWHPSTAYLGSALIKDSNANLQQAQGSGGTSGLVVPVWNTNVGGITNDAAPLTWKNTGPAPLRTGVDSSMQVQFKGRQFQIEAVLNPDERPKLLLLMCVEINDSKQQ